MAVTAGKDARRGRKGRKGQKKQSKKTGKGEADGAVDTNADNDEQKLTETDFVAVDPLQSVGQW